MLLNMILIVGLKTNLPNSALAYSSNLDFNGREFKFMDQKLQMNNQCDIWSVISCLAVFFPNGFCVDMIILYLYEMLIRVCFSK